MTPPDSDAPKKRTPEEWRKLAEEEQRGTEQGMAFLDAVERDGCMARVQPDSDAATGWECGCGAPISKAQAGCARWPDCMKQPDSDAREVVRIPGFDAMEWVAMWRETIAEHPDIPTDDGAMLGWFANAIMRGYDEYPRRPHDDQLLLPLSLAQRILAALDYEHPPAAIEFRALAAELRAVIGK